MKKHSKKRTERVTAKAGCKGVTTSKAPSSSVKGEVWVSRFHDMSKDLERVPPLHIPGYKTRG